MIAKIREDTLRETASLREALGLTGEGVPRIAVTGAGGKTSTVKRLTAEFQALGATPLVLTTTHMYAEDSPLFLYHPRSVEEIAQSLDEKGCLFVGEKTDRKRMKNVSKEMFEEILALPVPVLMEADGARRLPVKFPGEQEPVIPREAERVLWVCGLDALGHPLEEVCFRPELAAAFLGKAPEAALEPRDVARLALSFQAGRKGVLPHMEYAVILNKADTEQRRRLAMETAAWIEREERVPVIVTAREGESR